jgi:hypothetical protein
MAGAVVPLVAATPGHRRVVLASVAGVVAVGAVRSLTLATAVAALSAAPGLWVVQGVHVVDEARVCAAWGVGAGEGGHDASPRFVLNGDAVVEA